MLYVGLDLGRKRLDYHACLADGELAAAGACPPDGDGLAHLDQRLGAEGPVLAAIESMSGARSCMTSSSWPAGTCGSPTPAG
jgi:hypothetical protein